MARERRISLNRIEAKRLPSYNVAINIKWVFFGRREANIDETKRPNQRKKSCTFQKCNAQKRQTSKTPKSNGSSLCRLLGSVHCVHVCYVYTYFGTMKSGFLCMGGDADRYNSFMYYSCWNSFESVFSFRFHNGIFVGALFFSLSFWHLVVMFGSATATISIEISWIEAIYFGSSSIRV